MTKKIRPEERERINRYHEKFGVYHFGQDNITFEIDTIGTKRIVIILNYLLHNDL